MTEKKALLTGWPDGPPPHSTRLPATIDNVDHVLRHVGITVRYNEVKKRDEIDIPGRTGSTDNVDDVTLNYIISLAAQHHLPTGNVPGFVEAIANRNAYNPMADWIRSKPWDRTDRMSAVYATIVEQEGYPPALKHTLVRKWLRSIVAAAIMPRFHARGVLTLQGAQSMGKSSWIKRLISDPALADAVVKLGHHLDAANKDSILSAISFAIVELGELDSSFKKDIARLKGFLTDDHDRVRRPYGKREASYPRRTVFAATVNDPAFLMDSTGNARFWTIPVDALDYRHDIDMQQVFAQLAVEVEAGEIWWLTPAEERVLEEMNSHHQVVSPVAEKLAEAVDHDRIGADGLPAMSATEVAEQLGFAPTIPIARETGAALRALLRAEPKKINGIMKWRVPLRDSCDGVIP